MESQSQSQSQTSGNTVSSSTVGDVSRIEMIYEGVVIKLFRVGSKLGLSLDGQQVFTCSLFPDAKQDELDVRADAQD